MILNRHFRISGICLALAAAVPIQAQSLPQTITFDAIPNQILGISPFQIAAKASSVLPVKFTSTAPAVCKVAGTLVALLGAGTCSITASQPGNANYSAAAPVTQSFTVNAAGPSGTLTAAQGGPFAAGANPGSVAVGDFNGDGIPDFAIADWAGNNVTVLLGSALGGFSAALGSPFAAGKNPAFITVGDFNVDGFQDLAVADYSGNAVTVLLGSGSGGFNAAPGSPFAVGTSPRFIAVGDFNGDGVQDLGVVDAGGVTALLGNGSGGFSTAPGSPFAAGTNPLSVAVGDFNGDGIQDLAAAGGGVTVLLGNGSGGFSARSGSPFAGGADIVSVAVGDFNRDGVPDLALANDTSPGTVTVLLGDGSGGFGAAPGGPFATGFQPTSVAAGDFNGDGVEDLAVANMADSTVTVLLGNGSGGFSAASGSPFATGTHPLSIAVADFNGDGIEDIVTANYESNNVTVLLGGKVPTISVLTTTSPLTVPFGQSVPLTLTVSDTATAFGAPTGTATFQDGTTVLGTSSRTASPYTFTASGLSLGANTLTASYGGDGSTSPSTSNGIAIQVVQASQSITFNALSIMTLGAPPFTVSASASSGLPVSFASNTPLVCMVSGSTVTLVTLGACSITASQTGNADYAAATPVTQSFQINLQAETQTITFDVVPNQILGVSPFPIAAEASSGLAVSFTSNTPKICRNASTLVTLLGAGTCSITVGQPGNASYSAAAPVTRSFTVKTAKPSATLVQAPGSPFAITGHGAVAVGDFNGDGIPDLAVCAGAGLAVMLGDGSGGFKAGPVVPGAYGSAVGVGDFNGDGFQDLAVTNNFGANTVTVLLGDGSGGFAAAPKSPFATGPYPGPVLVADLNGDGIQDLVIGHVNANQSSVTVLLGDGLGGFSATQDSPLAVGGNPSSIAVADFNGDGVPDLAIVSEEVNGTVTVLLGDRSGSFSTAPGSPIAAGIMPSSVVVGDFNSDGKPDLAIATNTNAGGIVIVLLGNGAGGFSAAPGSPFAANMSPLVVGDFNGDGIPDLAGANYGAATVLLGNGSGGFDAPGIVFPISVFTTGLAVADFNGDGAEDLAVPDYSSIYDGYITVLLGSSGKVATTSLLTASSPPNFLVGASVPLTLVVSTAAEVIGPLTGTVTFWDGSTALGTASQSASPYTFTASALGVGNHTLTATYDGDSRTSASTSDSIVFQIYAAPPSSQTITFAPIGDVAFGIAPFALGATASSGLVVSYASNTPYVCTVSGATVTLVEAGACYITASQAGDADYLAADSVTQRFTINKGSQTITFDPIPNQIFGGSPLPLVAQASSGLAVGIASTTPGVCKTAKALVTLLAAGTCSITASQPGSTGYNAAPSVTQSFAVNQAKASGALAQTAASPYPTGAYPRSIAVGDFNRDGFADVATANWGDGTVTVLLGDGSGGLRAAKGSPISVGGGPQSVAVGDFNGDGVPDLAIAGARKSVLLGDGTGAFAPPPDAPPAALGGDAPVVVGDFNGDGIQDLAVGGQAMGFAVLLGSGSGGFTTAPLSFGTPGAEALAAGDFNGDGIQDIAVADWVPGSLAPLYVYIWFGNDAGGSSELMAFTAPANATHPTSLVAGDFNGDGILDLALGASNGITIALGNGTGGFSVTSGSPYQPTYPSSLVVADVNGDGIPDLIPGGPDMRVLLGDGSGAFRSLQITFPAGAYPIAAGVADFNGDGVTDLAVIDWKANTASVLLGGKAATSSVLTTTAPTIVPAGQPVSLTLTVSDTGFAFSGPTGAAKFFDGTTLLGQASQTASPYTFTTTLSAGSHTLTASYAGDSLTAASTSNSVTVQVGKPQTITFGPLSNVTLEVGQITLGASASSGLAVTFASAAISTGYCSVYGNVVTIISTGTCSITANQAGNAVYAPAPPVMQSFQIVLGQTITFGALSDVILGAVFTLSATANSYLPATFTSNTLAVCTVSGSTVTTVAVGTCSITASQAGNTTYAPAPPVTQSFAVEAGKPQTVKFSPPGNVTLGVAPFTLSATASSGLAVTFASNTLSVCTVSGSAVTAVAAGTCSITASQAGNATYSAATPVTHTLRIVGAETITFDPIPNQTLGVSPFQIAAQAAGGVPVSLASTTPQVCAVASTSVRLLSAGTCSIKAAQIGDAGIAASTALTRSFTVSAAKPSGALTGAGFSLGILSSPEALAAGDFNGDGIPDIAVADMGDNTVTVLLGNGSGGFTQAPGSPFAAGTQPHDIAAGDFNGDGIQDLALASEYSSNITILLGNGSGGFSAAPGVPLPTGIYSWALRVGDFNNDGIQDLVVAGAGYTNVIVFWGNGAGGFVPAPLSPIAIGIQPDSFAVADLNADGNQDIVVVDNSNNRLIVLLGDGFGGFTPATGSPFAVGAGPTSVAVGDFNRDGMPDLAATNSSDSTVTILLGDGSGNFSPAPGSPLGLATIPNVVSVGDFNGDGIPDLAIVGIADTNSRAGALTILLGNGSGGFSLGAGPLFTAGRDPNSLVVGDFNGDGILDLATANVDTNTVAIFLGGQAPTVSALSTTSPSTIAYGQSVPLTLTVSDTVAALSTPTGAATFSDGATVLGTATQTASPYTFTVTGLSPGSHTLTASYSGDSRTIGSTSNSIAIQVGPSPQTITFGALHNAGLGAPPFSILATASSGLPVSFASNTTLVCSVSGRTVATVAAGSCSITASQGGSAAYAAAASVTQTFNVIPGLYIAGQVTLSGAGLSGIAVALSGSQNASTATDAGGYYSFTALAAGGSYSVTPSNSAYVFNPPSGSVDSLGASQAIDFTASAIVGNLTASSTTVGPSVAANLLGAPTALDAPTPFCVPILITLNPGVNVDSLSFTVQITPVGAAPPLTDALTFTKDPSSSSAPSITPGANSIHVQWASVGGVPWTGARKLGVVGGTVPAGTDLGQSYVVSVTDVIATDSGNPLIVTAGVNGAITVTLCYLVGDVAPYTSGPSPDFGDGSLNILDLVQELFAVNNVPGFRPAAGSDRFDAMDLFPADAAATRGGDGVLDIRDLILELFRVNDLDAARPMRASQGPCSGGAGTGSETPAAVSPLEALAPEPRGDAQGTLALGTPEAQGIPVYLQATRDLVHVALTFALGDGQSSLSFTPAPGAPASLAYSRPGALAVVVPGGVSGRAGRRLLLGYVAGPSGVSLDVKVYGMSAASLDDNREVRLAMPLEQ